MEITAVKTISIDRSLHGVLGYLVTVETDEGILGLGEVAADCHPATVAFAIRRMDLVGRDPLAIEALWQTFYQQQFWRGGPISTLVGVHLGAYTANFEMLEYPRQLADRVEVLNNMPVVKNGAIAVPEGPGWGVEVDEAALAKFSPEV